jgi:hypothetical protein
MTSRRDFLKTAALLPLISMVDLSANAGENDKYPYPRKLISDFCKRLKPLGRILETEGYYVWCASPIDGPDGKVHLFFSRWIAKKKMGGWINGCEICRAVADSAESNFEYVETILAPRGPGFWDGTTCHNPLIKFVDGKYCLFYMGNSNGKTNTKRIGLAMADSLNGSWIRPDKPLLEAGQSGAWDDHCTTNPAFVKHPNGQYWLYYKGWNDYEYVNAPDPKIRGNRKYGLAIADKLEGPYIRYEHNPILDFSGRGNNTQLEDAYVWIEHKKFKMIVRDMGYFNHEVGLYMESKDGIQWSEPKIAYYGAKEYLTEQPTPDIKEKWRFERPQLLIRNGHPAYLFTAIRGGKYKTTSPFVFKIL